MIREEGGRREQMEDLNDLDKGEEAGQDATNEVVVKSYEGALSLGKIDSKKNKYIIK